MEKKGAKSCQPTVTAITTCRHSDDALTMTQVTTGDAEPGSGRPSAVTSVSVPSSFEDAVASSGTAKKQGLVGSQ
jgi:hypothetical protein